MQNQLWQFDFYAHKQRDSLNLESAYENHICNLWNLGNNVFQLVGVRLSILIGSIISVKVQQKKESGIYIVNEKMYEILTKKQGGVTFVVDREYDFIESTNYSRIKSVVDEKNVFQTKSIKKR